MADPSRATYYSREVATMLFWGENNDSELGSGTSKIWFINRVDKPNFRVSLPQRSTTVSLETNPLYSVVPLVSPAHKALFNIVA